MGYNLHIETEVVSEDLDVNNNVIEPVSLEDAKRHMNMIFQTSASYVFDDDDIYISSLINSARNSIEQFTGLCLVKKVLKSAVKNELGGVDIPFGPVESITVVKDKKGNEVTVDIIGNQFKEIETCGEYFLIEYKAGYADASKVPTPLKRAILEQVDFMYKNRGGQENQYASSNVDLCKAARESAAPYKRISCLV